MDPVLCLVKVGRSLGRLQEKTRTEGFPSVVGLETVVSNVTGQNLSISYTEKI